MLAAGIIIGGAVLASGLVLLVCMVGLALLELWRSSW